MTYKITMNIQIQETDNTLNNGELIQSDRGSFSMTIPTTVGHSIDQCEQALLSVNHEALRDALSSHLSNISEENATNRIGIVKKTTLNIELMEK